MLDLVDLVITDGNLVVQVVADKVDWYTIAYEISGNRIIDNPYSVVSPSSWLDGIKGCLCCLSSVAREIAMRADGVELINQLVSKESLASL